MNRQERLEYQRRYYHNHKELRKKVCTDCGEPVIGYKLRLCDKCKEMKRLSRNGKSPDKATAEFRAKMRRVPQTTFRSQRIQSDSPEKMARLINRYLAGEVDLVASK